MPSGGQKTRYRFEIRHMDYLHVFVQHIFRFWEHFEKFRIYIELAQKNVFFAILRDKNLTFGKSEIAIS